MNSNNEYYEQLRDKFIACFELNKTYYLEKPIKLKITKNIGYYRDSLVLDLEFIGARFNTKLDKMVFIYNDLSGYITNTTHEAVAREGTFWVTLDSGQDFIENIVGVKILRELCK